MFGIVFMLCNTGLYKFPAVTTYFVFLNIFREVKHLHISGVPQGLFNLFCKILNEKNIKVKSLHCDLCERTFIM